MKILRASSIFAAAALALSPMAAACIWDRDTLAAEAKLQSELSPLADDP